MSDSKPETRVEARAATPGEILPGIGRAKALFLLAAGMSFLMSVYLFFGGDAERGIFVGLWVPSILSAGTLLFGSEDHE
ncbi:MAG: hypothetical protein ACQGVC_19395 [Myxococcota bacterium]